MGRSEFTPFGSPEDSRRSKAPLLIAAGGLALVVVAFSLGRVSTSSSDEASPPEQAQEEESSAPGDGIREEVSIEGQLFSADDLTWSEHAGEIVPFSAEHGPHENEGGWVRDFSRTPQGALLAGAHIYTQAVPNADLPPDAIEASLKNQLIGDYAPIFIAESMENGFEPASNLGYTRFEAYKYHEYSDNDAVFELVVANLDPDTEEVAIRVAVVVSMAWRDGDWRLYLPEDPLDNSRILDSLEGLEILPGADG